MQTLRTLYDAIEPYDSGYIRVSPVHELYYEQCGTPNGKPVVFLHGGPGAGLVALAFLLGWFAIFYGIVLIALGLRLRRLLRELQDRVAVPLR